MDVLVKTHLGRAGDKALQLNMSHGAFKIVANLLYLGFVPDNERFRDEEPEALIEAYTGGEQFRFSHGMLDVIMDGIATCETVGATNGAALPCIDLLAKEFPSDTLDRKFLVDWLVCKPRFWPELNNEERQHSWSIIQILCGS